MSDDTAVTTEVRFAELASHWGLVLTYGLISIGLGLVLAVWPGETLVVVAVLVAIQLIIAGVLRIVMALGSSSLDGGVRVLMAMVGGLSLVVGLLCLRDPVQTLLVVGLLLGVWWVVSGVVDVVTAVIRPVPGRRTWDLVSGLVSIVAGGYLLVDPHLSLGVLVVVICAWLFLIGAAALFAAFKLRSAGRDETRAPAGRPSTPPAAAL
jgi:uncharacterized membrane protein HdeD (DUF308 family)